MLCRSNREVQPRSAERSATIEYEIPWLAGPRMAEPRRRQTPARRFCPPQFTPSMPPKRSDRRGAAASWHRPNRKFSQDLRTPGNRIGLDLAPGILCWIFVRPSRKWGRGSLLLEVCGTSLSHLRSGYFAPMPRTLFLSLLFPCWNHSLRRSVRRSRMATRVCPLLVACPRCWRKWNESFHYEARWTSIGWTSIGWKWRSESRSLHHR